MEIFLIRHGKTMGNLYHRYIGTTDEPVLEEEMEKLKSQNWPDAEAVFESPLLRCRQTAEIICPGRPVRMIDEFAECDFGSFENRNWQELKGNAEYQAWIDSNGTLPFPEGESRAEFIDRVCAGMENAADYLRNYAQSNMCRDCGSDREVTVAAVVHGGTIMALLSHYGGGDYYDYQVENAGGFTCRILIAGEQIRFVTQERGFR